MANLQREGEQAELFTDLSRQAKKVPRHKWRWRKIAVSIPYENIFIFIIGFILLLIVCYSLGVERGRHLARLEGTNIQIEKEQVQKSPRIKPPKPREKKLKIKLAEKIPPKESPYIQVASFRTEKYARQEIKRLREKGFRPYTRTWGKYKVVCVGGYKSKEEAIRDLKQLRKLYADCILRHK